MKSALFLLLLAVMPVLGFEAAPLPGRYSRAFVLPEDLSRWWTVFGDAHLERLIRLACAAHEDVRLAKERAAEASAVASQAKASLLPSGNVSLSYTASQRSNNSPAIPRFEPPPGLNATQDLIPRRYSILDAAASGSYEVDWLGGQRGLSSAATMDRQAVEESWREAIVAVSAETARQYLEYREAQALHTILLRLLDAERLKQDLLSHRVRAGLAVEADEHRAASRVAEVAAQLEQMQGRIDVALIVLSRYTGQPPTALRADLGATDVLPEVSGGLSEGTPGDLLRRRPDVRRALLQLSAAKARRESAEKDWFPRFRLTASAGGQSGSLTNLLSPQSILSTFAPSVSWGALNYRHTKSVIAQNRAQEEQQELSLAKAVQEACREVEETLTRIADEERRGGRLRDSAAALARAADSAHSRFAAGLDTMIPAIEAEARELSVRLDLLQSHSALLKHHVGLYRALGGGW